MQVVCFAGYSGSGKTTLIEQVIPVLIARGQQVSVIKHTHHRFDIDTPGKDTWRHRQAGAFEVLAASDQRVVLMRELPKTQEPDVHALIAQLDSRVDWVLVEGFKDCDLPKLEVLANAPEANGKAPLYPQDAAVQAVVLSPARQLLPATALPQLPRDAPAAVAQWLLVHSARFAYTPPCVFATDTAG
ncbi:MULTISPECIES: molybdopterin-guanine dinucleotide biosynthesis protein B [Comamonas]|jgi:molybdopterin-guanine dinucleotide biosynthesis protein B|uniref:Molybdopterin-guanine dinucleotide biosynthesis protein B n=1 Tax=Comamonas squillarum TaxID=2977320 RepID=A0ABY5ZWK1_9BURK|nr:MULTISPECIES: molybdopterin-guanine dinucleotide biosynthesis protein B [Comamonas]PWB20399.1 molybdopterin-guanine dinucleotide biosynthesis protein B [Comamonas sp. JNW]UXC18311.1 molybdopterin-guanine dinucleotide biosynthesis protein B [Comamonas sp. PR12]